MYCFNALKTTAAFQEDIGSLSFRFDKIDSFAFGGGSRSGLMCHDVEMPPFVYMRRGHKVKLAH